MTPPETPKKFRSYVPDKTDLREFTARAVLLGPKENSQVQIRQGLKPEEQAVVDHGFTLKSALLISRLGAGCADD